MADRLLDTNAVSAAMQGRSVFSRYLARVAEDGLLLTSVIVEGEIRFGISRLAEGSKRRGLTNVLVQVMENLHDTLPIARAVAARYAEVKTDLWARGKPMSENDLWIAATALSHNLTLVTSDSTFRNIKKLLVEDWSQG
ncbi:MAG: PIN domain-containing protein [Acidobacteriota bacterium]